MKALLIGHCVPMKTMTTAFLSFRSASAQVLPAGSLRAKRSIFLPSCVAGVSARETGVARRATAAASVSSRGEQRAVSRMEVPRNRLSAGENKRSGFVGGTHLHVLLFLRNGF